MTSGETPPPPAAEPEPWPAPAGPVAPGTSGPATAESVPAANRMDADRALLAEPARQSPVAVVFIAWRFIRGLGFSTLAVAAIFLFGGGIPVGLLGIGLVGACVGLVFMVLAWWRFVFLVQGDELLVTKGVIGEERLAIPLDRVQSVSIDQKLLHRPIGLVSVKVDTAGSSDAEFQIDAVDRARAEALQRLASGYRTAVGSTPGVAGEFAAAPGSAAGAAPIEDTEVVRRRTLPELLRIGLTRWPWAGLVALAPLAAFLDDIVDRIPFDFVDEQVVEDNLPSEFGLRFVLVVLAIASGVLVLLGIFGTLLQMTQEVVSNWDLRLIRTSTGFRRTAGLFSKTSRGSTLNRVQAIRFEQNPAQRWFGISRMTLPTIGDGDLVIPGVTEPEATKVRGIVFGVERPPTLDRMISRLAVFLAVRNSLVFTTLVVVGAFVTLRQWWVVVGYLNVPIQWLAARRQWRLRRWSLSSWRIAESLEFVNRRTAELELIKAQTVTVSQSFFERRRGLATVKVDTAEGHLAVPLIPVEDARAVRDRVLFTAESQRRAWM